MFPFWGVGSDGLAAATALGTRHVSFLGSWSVRAPGKWAALTRLAGLHWRLLPSLSSRHVSFSGAWVGWVVHGKRLGSRSSPFMFAFWVPGWDGWAGAGLPFSSLHWDGWAAAKGLGTRWRIGSDQDGCRWAPFMFPFWAPGSDGWATATGRCFCWAPFMFPFSAPGSDGWAAPKKLGSHWAPFILPFWSGRPRSWAPINLPSCFQSGLLGRMGGPRPLHVSFFLGPGSDGWAVAKKLSFHWAPFIIISFLGSWVGWVGRGHEKLGSHWAPFILPFWAPGSDGWSAAKKLGLHLLSGSWVGWVGRSKKAGLPLRSLLFPFWAPGSDGWAAAKELGSRWAPFMFHSFWAPGSDGWAAAKKLGSLYLSSRWAPLHVSFFLGPGSDGWAAATGLGSHWAPWVGWVVCGQGWAFVGFPSCFLLSGLLGRMGGPRSRSWARIGPPSSFLGSWADGWAPAKSWAPFMFPFWGGMGWWAPGLLPVDGPRSQGWLGSIGLPRSQGCSHH